MNMNAWEPERGGNDAPLTEKPSKRAEQRGAVAYKANGQKSYFFLTQEGRSVVV